MWGAHLLASYFLPLHTVHGVFMARILEWLAIPTSGGPHLSELFTLMCLGWPCKAWLTASLGYASPLPWQGCDHEGTSLLEVSIRVFKLCIWFPSQLLDYSDFPFFSMSVLVSFCFLENCPLYPNCHIYCCKVVHNIFLKFFWCL